MRLHVNITAELVAAIALMDGECTSMQCFFCFSNVHVIAFPLLIKTSCFESIDVQLVNYVLH